MTPEARLALECIQDATNRKEAELLAALHGYFITDAGLCTYVHSRQGWLLELSDDTLEIRGRLRGIFYSQIKQVLAEVTDLP